MQSIALPCEEYNWYCLTNWLVILLLFFTWQYSISVYFLERPLCGEYSFLYIMLNICSVGRQYDKYPWSSLSSALWTMHVKNMVSLHWCICMLEAPSFCLSLTLTEKKQIKRYGSTLLDSRLQYIKAGMQLLAHSCCQQHSYTYGVCESYKVVVHICSAKTVWWPLILECRLLKNNYSVDTKES